MSERLSSTDSISDISRCRKLQPSSFAGSTQPFATERLCHLEGPFGFLSSAKSDSEASSQCKEVPEPRIHPCITPFMNEEDLFKGKLEMKQEQHYTRISQEVTSKWIEEMKGYFEVSNPNAFAELYRDNWKSVAAKVERIKKVHDEEVRCKVAEEVCETYWSCLSGEYFEKFGDFLDKEYGAVSQRMVEMRQELISLILSWNELWNKWVESMSQEYFVRQVAPLKWRVRNDYLFLKQLVLFGYEFGSNDSMHIGEDVDSRQMVLLVNKDEAGETQTQTVDPDAMGYLYYKTDADVEAFSRKAMTDERDIKEKVETAKEDITKLSENKADLPRYDELRERILHLHRYRKHLERMELVKAEEAKKAPHEPEKPFEPDYRHFKSPGLLNQINETKSKVKAAEVKLKTVMKSLERTTRMYVTKYKQHHYLFNLQEAETKLFATRLMKKEQILFGKLVAAMRRSNVAGRPFDKIKYVTLEEQMIGVEERYERISQYFVNKCQEHPELVEEMGQKYRTGRDKKDLDEAMKRVQADLKPKGKSPTPVKPKKRRRLTKEEIKNLYRVPPKPQLYKEAPPYQSSTDIKLTATETDFLQFFTDYNKDFDDPHEKLKDIPKPKTLIVAEMPTRSKARKKSIWKYVPPSERKAKVAVKPRVIEIHPECYVDTKYVNQTKKSKVCQIRSCIPVPKRK